jgi:hypothetical protein
MFLRPVEITPKPGLLAGDADFKRPAWFSGDASDTPMISVALTAREQAAGKFFDALAELALDFLEIHSFLLVPLVRVS